MAPTPTACPIRLVAVHLLTTAGEISRILWLDAEGHLSRQPHWLPREQALILASNQQLVMGSSAEVRVL